MKKCTLIVKGKSILVCITGTWPKLFICDDPDEARVLAYEIEEQKENTNVVIL